MIWDSTYLLLIPAFILAIYAQGKVQKTYKKYMKYATLVLV